MINKSKATEYLVQCEMISRWAKKINGLKADLVVDWQTEDDNAPKDWKKQFLNKIRADIKQAKIYYKNSQRGLEYLQTGKMRGQTCLYGGRLKNLNQVLENLRRKKV